MGRFVIIQQSGENLKLKFEPYTYGPYAQAVDKVLYALNGKYLKGLEQMEAKPFESLEKIAHRIAHLFYSFICNYLKLIKIKNPVNQIFTGFCCHLV